MPYPFETKKDSAAEYAEARRAWQLAREVALRGAAFGDAKPQAAAVRAVESDDRQGMITFRSYGAARDSLVGELLKDAVAHDAGRFDEIGRRSDRMLVPRVGPPELTKLRVALSFWDGWIDARNRGWQSDGDIAKAEWPVLARRIAADLTDDREISDARVGARFDASADASQG
jgi:hypothetical protein